MTQLPASEADPSQSDTLPVSDTDLQRQNDQLRAALQEAQMARDQWQKLHAQLHTTCVDRLLPVTQ